MVEGQAARPFRLRTLPFEQQGCLTDGRGQDPENQLRQLREWCRRLGHPVVREYVGHENGGKGVEYRKQLDAMFAGAARREFDFLLVWSLDRFSREAWRRQMGTCSA